MMPHELTQRLIRFAISNDIITDEDRELCEYSYGMMFARLFSFATLLLIGLLFGSVLGALIFHFTFFPVRIYAGGFHSRGYTGCYLASVAAFVSINCVYKLAEGIWVTPMCVLGSVLSGIIIFCMSPIADPNKPIDEHETKKYQEKARLIVSIELLIIVVIARVPAANQILFFMSAALIMAATLLLIPCSKEIAKT